MIAETEQLILNKAVRWTSDPTAESQMKAFGITWEVTEIPLDQIDLMASHGHTGRLDVPVDSELAEEYAVAMSNGDAFPRIVVTPFGKGKYLILGGNTRHAALKLLGVKSAPMYLVKITDDEKLTMFPRVLNRAHGKRTSRKEAIRLAVNAVRKFAWPIAKASEHLKIPARTIHTSLKEDEVREVLVAKGISTKATPQSTMIALSKITNENVLLPVAKLVLNAGLTADETAKVVKEVTSIRKSEIDMLAKVAELTKQYAPQDMGNQPLLPRVIRNQPNYVRRDLLRYVSGIENLLKGKRSLKQVGIVTKEDGMIIRGRLVACSEKFSSFCV